MTLLVREGALPGSADWTHEHADAANTRVSRDQLVKAPLGLLWFGGPSNDAILPRHGHGPQPQVVDGRLFIEGVDLLRAMDIYTGRVLWEASLPGLGTLFDNTAHQPGANASGTNYIATRDGIYVAYRQSCLRLDPVDGRVTAEFKLPSPTPSDDAPLWGYLNVFEDYLVGGSDPQFDPSLSKSRGDNDNYSSSQRLFVMDRTTGSVLWSAAAKSGFRHNAVCIGGGRIYCIDRMSGPQLARLKRRGESPVDKPRLVVFDLKSGQEVWSTDNDVFGTWLSYSREREVLVEAGRVARDTLNDEPKGMRAYNASNGSILWLEKSLAGPAMIHRDTILMAGNACDLLSGATRMREHPLSGEPVEWTWSRNYGCNTPLASEHLLTFRSGAAGYFDYCNDGGTGNFGGFRSSCSNNLIVAGGLLNAPDYTRTCTCSYQNQTSLALIHMPDAEMWTSFGSQSPKQAVRRVGINLAAPGDRKADDGTLWLESPSVGGSSPSIPIAIEPREVAWFRRHSSQIVGADLTWVAASGATGLTSLKVKLANTGNATRRYTLSLHFIEPDPIQVGDRVFDVKVQGKPAIESLDVLKEAGGQYRALVKAFAGVEVGSELVIDFAPNPAAKFQQAVLSGVHIQAEGW
jgi:outer membrane protein assembly factor BamB